MSNIINNWLEKHGDPKIDKEVEMEAEQLNITMAEQQLLGFFHAKRGYSLTDLISSMDLKEEEWKYIDKNYWLDITDAEREEIEEYFNK